MAGKLNNSTTDVLNDPALAKAYCEGRKLAKAAGTITYASATTGSVGANTGLTWTGKVPGNGLRVRLADPGVADGSLAVALSGLDLLVSLATGAAGNITTGVEGNDNAITWTPAGAHQQWSVTLLDPEDTDQELAVAVSGNDITVSLATDSGGTITSTAAEVMAAVEASVAASALCTVDDTGASDGTGVVVADSSAIGAVASTAAQVDAAVGNHTAANALVGVANTGGSSGAGTAAAASTVLSGCSYTENFNSFNSVAYLAGFVSWTADPSGHVTVDCCADEYGGGYS